MRHRFTVSKSVLTSDHQFHLQELDERQSRPHLACDSETEEGHFMKQEPTPIPYSDVAEVIPPDEPRDITLTIAAMKKVLEISRQANGLRQSEVHVKTHGYALGEFLVSPGLPPELAQGLFSKPATYAATVRFSSSAGRVQSDTLPDGRGIAIKIHEPIGELLEGPEALDRSQDFLMINHRVFFAATVKDYLRLQELLARGDASGLVKFTQFLTAGEWNPLHWHWKEFLNATRILAKVPAPLTNQTYFSMAPIRFGNYVVKYRLRPSDDPPEAFSAFLQIVGTSADAFRLALEATLRDHALCFDFQVQLRTNLETMPIEDPTIEWPESESPFRTVARLLLPKQEIAPLHDQPAFKNLSFNVWHALADHRPLGGINRVRRAAYALSSEWRKQQID